MKSKYDIRTGVIGIGSMGKNHARIYNELSNLVGVADVNQKQGTEVANRFGISYFEDYHDMLSKVDAVTIAVPTYLHKEVAKETTAAGVHLLVEKPLAANSIDAEAIIEASDNSNLILAVGHIERHNEIVKHAKDSIDKGEWGDILTLCARRFSNYPSRIHDVGVLFDLTIHDVDIITYLVDSKVIEVFALGGKSKSGPHEDYVDLLMKFEDGRVGLCETNWLTPMKVRELSITSTTCYTTLNYLKQEIEILSSKYGEIEDSDLYSPPMEIIEQKIEVNKKEPLRNELIDFLGAIDSSTNPLVSGIEGLKAVKIVEAGLESLRTNSVVIL